MNDQNIFKLLKHLRGDKTQKEMSKLLNLREDEYHRWEVGYKKIKLNDFKRILKLVGFDFDIVYKETLQIYYLATSTRELVLQLEQLFPCDTDQFLKRAGYSESKWWRLKNEKKDLFLHDLFMIIHHRSYKLYKIFHRLGFNDYELEFTPRSLSTKSERFKFYMRTYDFFPTLSSMIYLKEVHKIQSVDEKCYVIALRLNQPTDLIKKIIKNLILEGILVIKQNNELDFAIFENHLDEDKKNLGREIYRNIFDDSIVRIDSNESCQFSYRIAPVSKEARKKIQETQTRFSNEIYDIIINDSPDERTEVLKFITSSFFV